MNVNESKQQEKSSNRRGTNPKSLENLAKGRNKHGAPRRGLSWKELIEKVGNEKPPVDSPAAKLGATWKLAVVRAAFRHAAAGNATILKELMDRSEGKVVQPNTNLNLDLSSLTMEQLERISKGEDVTTVLATSSPSGD